MSEARDQEVPNVIPTLVIRTTLLEALHRVGGFITQLLFEVAVKESNSDDATVIRFPVVLPKRTPKDVTRTIYSRFRWDAVDVERIAGKLLGPLRVLVTSPSTVSEGGYFAVGDSDLGNPFRIRRGDDKVR